ncbi:MAG: hypothetical protein IPH07_20620 [Deltaproteobacteria bacterium]|nr:hypothetical protein [Deltaproteobacteria bacterium]MBK8239902.1 hypothetical protein [Deltaproteobacteria bacterium]MBK8716115.1 hypothetical protein [Deltaproteobacteria bacterium]MBP7286812.1 hypothetical protein [Nannocystaceae bacterium]
MSKSSNKWVAVGLLGVAGVGAWMLGQRMFGGDDAVAESAKHAVNQVWIERLPTDQRDMVHHLVLVRHARGRIGAVGRSSQWRHFVELFQWGLEGEKLSVFLPQEQQKASLRVRTWECADEAPEPFELCLELGSGKRTQTLYSRKDWIIEPNDVDGSIAELTAEQPELAAVLAGLEPSDAAEPDADAVEHAEQIDLLNR